MPKRGRFYYYWTRFFEHPGASRQVVWLPLRLGQFLVMQAFGLKLPYRIRFGDKKFRFRFLPLGRGQGARGAFFLREGYEPLLEFGASLLRRGDTAIDCGANQGVYACAFSSAVQQEGRVVAMEPIPWQAERVRDNLALNGFDHCEVVEAAVSDETGEAELRMGDYEVSASIARDSGKRTLRVPTVTLDELAESRGILDSVSLLKLDVEGAEVPALHGGRRLLEHSQPVICAEVNKGTGPDIMGAVSPFDYTPFELGPDGFSYLTKFGAHSNVFFLPPHVVDRFKSERRVRHSPALAT